MVTDTTNVQVGVGWGLVPTRSYDIKYPFYGGTWIAPNYRPGERIRSSTPVPVRLIRAQKA